MRYLFPPQENIFVSHQRYHGSQAQCLPALGNESALASDPIQPSIVQTCVTEEPLLRTERLSYLPKSHSCFERGLVGIREPALHRGPGHPFLPEQEGGESMCDLRRLKLL